jgi:hypothetical protein
MPWTVVDSTHCLRGVQEKVQDDLLELTRSLVTRGRWPDFTPTESTMTTILKDTDVITLINVFTVDPSNQTRLVELLIKVTLESTTWSSHSRRARDEI